MTVLAVFSVWLLWVIGENFLTAPTWAWRGLAGLLGIISMLIIDIDHWWWGLGIGGGAAVLVLVTDLLVVLCDWVRMLILRRTRS